MKSGSCAHWQLTMSPQAASANRFTSNQLECLLRKLRGLDLLKGLFHFSVGADDVADAFGRAAWAGVCSVGLAELAIDVAQERKVEVELLRERGVVCL